MKHRNKQLMAAALAALCLGLTGCGTGAGSQAASSQAASSPPSVSSAAASREPVVAQGEGTLGSFRVELLSARKSKDFEGNPMAFLRLRWTNGSEKAESFSSALHAVIRQDGKELTRAFPSLEDKGDSEAYFAAAKPGETVELEYGVVLSKEDAPLEVAVEELLSQYHDAVTKTFSLEEG